MGMEKESYQLQFIGRELNAAMSGEKSSQLHARLISEAKKVKDLPGALYLATEAMPFDVMSGNYKRTPYNNQSNAFARTAIQPYYKPILYSHDDGSGGMFMPGMKPNIVGRVFSVAVADNGRGGKSIFTGQVITDKESIDRVNSFIDYSQSIAFYPQSYTCDVCGEDPMKGCGLESDVSRCYNLGKEVSTDKSKKKTLVTWSVIPSNIAEISFVAIPAYPDAQVLGIEQNSIGQHLVAPNVRQGALETFFQYKKKEGFIAVGDIPTGKENNNQTDSEKPPVSENSGTIGSEGNQEQDDMELKELAEKFEALKTELNSALEGFKTRIDEIATKVANATPAAPAAGAQGEGQDTAAGAGTAAQAEADKNAAAAQNASAGVTDLLNKILEENKKIGEQYGDLSKKFEEFSKKQESAPAQGEQGTPAKTEAELAAERNANAAAEAEAERLRQEAEAKAQRDANGKTQGSEEKPKLKPRKGMFTQSIIKR